ncbi:hypothetical protein ARAM_001162 [Aspergillus rambellii]|uniref:N-acetylgalactosaminide beta-1,3-galactosyltransferase n=2 Tax=Aspergillus subgen. Nidulantes TaxID=2720870 RepID=A0A0F8W4J5_9EURO|nr:hypothetical protein ARAM_001162 [Aspergillus rambellii]
MLHAQPHLRFWIFMILSTFAISLSCYVLYREWHGSSEPELTDWSLKPDSFTSPGRNDTGCSHLHGKMDNILVALKTGTTEALEKVPVHLETTLRCLPHYVIFSDYEEEFAGVHTYDILRSVSGETKRTNPDFGIYNRLHTLGRRGLTAEDWTDEMNGPFGKQGNPGWKLDKWKFVPMIDEALQIQPGIQWYMFVEADTYVVWSNLATWLARFDPEKPYYIGSPMQISGEVFAYGGSGIVLSNAAMRLVSRHRARHFDDVERMTADNWAGDHVLGKILYDLGVSLVRSWPMLLPSSVWEFPYFAEGHNRNPWCYPAVSYHHMSPEDIQNMWLFEQQWFGFDKHAVLLHRDVFKNLIHDVILSHSDDWDNLSSEHVREPEKSTEVLGSADECGRKCALTTDCLQFSFGSAGCCVSKLVVGGVRRPGVYSGWMTLRIKALLRNAKVCSQIQYV